MYRKLSLDSRNAAAFLAMRRNRFDIVMGFLHFQDEIDENNRYREFRPFVIMLENKFLEFYIPGRLLVMIKP